MKDNELIIREAEIQEGCALFYADEYVMDYVIDASYKEAQEATGFVPDFGMLWDCVCFDLSEWIGYTAFYDEDSKDFLYDYLDKMNDERYFLEFIKRNKICCKLNDNILNNPQTTLFRNWKGS
jgi:hypothetical protein